MRQAWRLRVMRLPVLITVALGLWAVACDRSAEQSGDTKTQRAAQGSVPHDQAVHGSHAVTCGCTLPDVGHCSEWVKVDGDFVELELPESSKLGEMPFCGKEGLTATLEGELADGKVTAQRFKLDEK